MRIHGVYQWNLFSLVIIKQAVRFRLGWLAATVPRSCEIAIWPHAGHHYSCHAITVVLIQIEVRSARADRCSPVATDHWSIPVAHIVLHPLVTKRSVQPHGKSTDVLGIERITI